MRGISTRKESIDNIKQAITWLSVDLAVDNFKKVVSTELTKEFKAPSELLTVLTLLGVIELKSESRFVNTFKWMKPSLKITDAYAEKVWFKVQEYRNQKNIKEGKPGRVRVSKPIYTNGTLGKSTPPATITPKKSVTKPVTSSDTSDKDLPVREKSATLTSDILLFLSFIPVNGKNVVINDRMIISGVHSLQFNKSDKYIAVTVTLEQTEMSYIVLIDSTSYKFTEFEFHLSIMEDK